MRGAVLHAPGDRVFFEPEENHWHGAAPNRFMIHIAIQQNDESGNPVTQSHHLGADTSPTRNTALADKHRLTLRSVSKTIRLRTPIR